MKSDFRIQEHLFVETSKNRVFSLIPAGRRVPITWEQSFTTYVADQRSFDLHLLRGVSAAAMDISTLGKWRISGIPPAPKGRYRVRVKIRVGVDGSVGLFASLQNQPLAVVFLTDAFPQIPLTTDAPAIPLESLVQQPCLACDSRFVTRATNWRDESFALCLDCGNEFELLETPGADKPALWDDLPSELLETLGIERPHKPGGLSAADLQELQEKGFDLNPKEENDLLINANKIIHQIPGMIFWQKKKTMDLDHEEVLRLAGAPLPEDARRNCPKCDAVISNDAKRCEWCGEVL